MTSKVSEDFVVVAGIDIQNRLERANNSPNKISLTVHDGRLHD